MSDTTSPFVFPEKAAHEVVLELIRAGKISYASDASDVFTHMLNHYRAESDRPQ
ncbi:hypothetical protein LME85_004610, partial [Salmonella enterica]|nr:hypothetical protein [Salmonella enterica]